MAVRPMRRPWKWAALAQAAAAALLVVAAPRLWQPRSEASVADAVIASHVRSLMANHLTDVASSDQHTVKPWLDAKLDFAPPVVDLTNGGFPFIFGRLAYFHNPPLAALLFPRRKKFV